MAWVVKAAPLPLLPDEDYEQEKSAIVLGDHVRLTHHGRLRWGDQSRGTLGTVVSMREPDAMWEWGPNYHYSVEWGYGGRMLYHKDDIERV